MYHIPNYWGSCSIPLIFPDGNVALNFNEIFRCGKFAVEFCRCYPNFTVLCKSSGGFFNKGKCFWKDFVEHFFFKLVRVFFQLFYFRKKFFFLINIRRVFNLFFNLFDLGSDSGCSSFYFFFEFCGLFA